MDDPAWSKGEMDKVWAISWLRSLKSAEVLAEQLIGYLFKSWDHKRLAMVLMVFEMAKAYLRFRAFFSGKETLMMEDNIFTFYMADEKRRELLKEKAGNVLGILAKYTKTATPEQMYKLVAKVLALKIREKKRPQEPERSGEQPNASEEVEKQGDRLLAIEQEAGVQNASGSAQPTEYELVVDEESALESLYFNEECMQRLSRQNRNSGLLRSLPIPEHLRKPHRQSARIRIAECIYILRPIFYCLSISLCEKYSWKPFFTSLGIDILALILRLDYKVKSIPEHAEIKERYKRILTSYFFYHPLYDFFTKPKIVEPVLNKLVPWETIRNFIIPAIDFRSSYSLLL